jgi:hypothetical protein
LVSLPEECDLPSKDQIKMVHGAMGVFAVSGIILSLIVLGFAIYSLRMQNATVVEEIAELSVYCSVLWGFIATWGMIRSARRLGARIEIGFYFAPRPEDPDELRLWFWGRQFACAFLITAISMGGFVLIMWLRGE